MKLCRYNVCLSTENRHPKMEMVEEVAYYEDNMRLPTAFVNLLEQNYHLSAQAEEHAYMIALSARMKPLAVFELSHGSVNNTIIGPREVYMRALLVGAVNIVIAHNHPGGDPAPSIADQELCRGMSAAGKLLHVRLLDFLILGDGSYFSFLEEGLIP